MVTTTSQTPSKRDKAFVSLGTRFTVPVVLLVAAIAVGAYSGLVRSSRATAMRSKEVAGDMVVKLAALSVMPAVVFGDEVEMKRAVDDLSRNPEVIDVELWPTEPPSDGVLAPLASHHSKEGRAIGKPAGVERRRSFDQDSFLALEPVNSLENKTVAVLAVRLSTARESAALAALSGQILTASVVTALCLVAAIVVVLRRTVVNPLQRLRRAAQRLGQGAEHNETESRDQVRFNDEVVELTSAFGDMAAAVRDREARLARRNSELRLILDSVDQGFLTALPDGTLLPERSAIVETWLGALSPNAKIWDVVERINPELTAWMEAAWGQLADGLFPLDAALEQLPKRLARAGRHFEFVYHPVMRGEEIEQIVIVLTDVTAEVERQKALAEQQEFSVLVDQFVRDRRGFYDFWGEASDLVKRVVGKEGDQTPEAVRRDIHTLKGNARFFGLTRLAGLCHSIEDAMRERGEITPSTEELQRIGELWSALSRRIEPLINGSPSFIEISEEEYKRLVAALRKRASFETLEELVLGLRREPTLWRLNRARDTLLSTCQKLGKAAPHVQIEHHDLRLPPGRFAPFWTVFTHVINNAADHGLESDAERAQHGKSVPGNIALTTELRGGELLVEISDDGAGIDWEKVKKLAEQRNLPARSQRELEAALMSDGFSLKKSVSDVSGRGVGLAAVRSVVTALGGRIELQSELNAGTTWRFRLPAGKLDDADVQESRPPQPLSVRAS